MCLMMSDLEKNKKDPPIYLGVQVVYAMTGKKRKREEIVALEASITCVLRERTNLS
jgi:hypothetical protein